MRRCCSVFLPTLSLVITLCAESHGQQFGNLTLGGGVLWPQTELSHYSDEAVSLQLRGDWQIPDARPIQLWADAGVIFFSSDEQEVTLSAPGGHEIPVDQEVSQQAYAGHLGIQLGSPTRQGFFRPRAAVGLGIYYFNTTFEWKGIDDDPLGDPEPFAEETTDSQWSLGWRGVLGADLFFKKEWGIAVEFVNDQVWSLTQREGEDSPEVVALFQGFSVGLVIPLETLMGGVTGGY